MTAGRELDVLVAEKVMGWTKRLPPGKQYKEPFPRFSTSIAEAWQVVEKLLSEGWQVTLKSLADRWNCHFWRPPLDVTMTDEQIGVECIESVTEAICLAALKVKGVTL